jgi:Sulfatase
MVESSQAANAMILHRQTENICVRLLLFHDGVSRNGPSSTLGNPPSREEIMQRKLILAVPPLCLFFSILLSISASAQSVVASAATGQAAESGKPARPNILFIIMDDVGIDQMQIFGYGGTTPPLTPNINAIARAGVRFRNVWAMPECCPSRAIFSEGRYVTGNE